MYIAFVESLQYGDKKVGAFTRRELAQQAIDYYVELNGLQLFVDSFACIVEDNRE